MHVHAMKPTLHEADFSGTEALLELVLLEDHLRYDDMRCLACIHKHVLRACAYAKEACALDDADGVHCVIYEVTQEIKRDIGSRPYPEIADKIRNLRKFAFKHRQSLHHH